MPLELVAHWKGRVVSARTEGPGIVLRCESLFTAMRRAARGLAIIVGGAVALAACVPADAPPGPLTSLGRSLGGLGGAPATGYTPEELALRDEASLFNETVLGGIATNAAIGAVLGALIAAAGDGGWQAVGQGAAIGGVAGGVYGAIDGYRVATRSEASRRQVREVQVMLDRVEAENRQLEQSIATTDAVIEQSRGRLAQARAQAGRGEIGAGQLQAERARAGQNVEAIDDLIAGASTRQREYAQVSQDMRRDGENTAQLDREIAQGQARLAQLKRDRDILASEIDSGRVG